jgi:hypothetical protein
LGRPAIRFTYVRAHSGDSLTGNGRRFSVYRLARFGGPMWVKRVLFLILGFLVVMSTALPASSANAAPGDRPRNVADVKAESSVLLQSGGALIVSVRVRCDSGWVAGDISATLTQGESTISGVKPASTPCDGKWHRVTLDLADGTGSFVSGSVTFSFLQYLVTNAETGDSAGAHDNGSRARLLLAA